ncbi:MAG: EAL domain-containing protein [Ilumatobacter sp.]
MVTSIQSVPTARPVPRGVADASRILPHNRLSNTDTDETTSAETGWLAAMCTETALAVVERAIDSALGLDEATAARLRHEVRIALGPAVGEVIGKMAAPDIALQPIVHIEGRTVIGYEALARFGAGTATADAFRRAADRGLQVEVEYVTLCAALRRLDDLPEHVFLGVNLSAQALLDDRIMTTLAHADTSRLVIELTQQADLDDVAGLKQSFRDLQGDGAVICVDGAGIGFFTASRVVELEPEMVKICRSLVTHCDLYPEQQTAIREMVAVARRIGALSVGIGVESVQERDVLQGIGVDAVQGHLFGAPSLELLDATLPDDALITV